MVKRVVLSFLLASFVLSIAYTLLFGGLYFGPWDFAGATYGFGTLYQVGAFLVLWVVVFSSIEPLLRSQSLAPQQSPPEVPDLSENRDDYIASVNEAIKVRRDTDGQCLAPLTSSEREQLLKAIQGLSTGNDQRTIIYLELRVNDRKREILFLGLLPLLAAASHSARVLYVGGDSSTMAAARMDFRRLMILEHDVDFMTTLELASATVSGRSIIWDLDTSDQLHPPTEKIRQEAASTLARVRQGNVLLVAVHQQGLSPITSFSS